MRQRLNLALALALVLLLGTTPIIGLASNAKLLIPTSHPKRDRVLGVPRNAGRSPAKPVQRATRLEGQTSTLLPNGSLLLIGGVGPDGPVATITINDPLRDEITTLPDLPLARAWHSATMLPDGRVLIVGGIGSDHQILSSALIFDPETREFQQLPKSGLSPRAYHTGTLLTDGQVLLAGGMSEKGRTVAKAELWDSKTKIAAGLPEKPAVVRRQHKATILSDGNVLLEGGIDDNNRALRTAELFNAEVGSFSFTSISSGQDDNKLAYLAASLPQDGSTEVQLDARIALRFSKAIPVESINSETVRLGDREATVAVKVVPAENGRLAFITPAEPLRANTTYTVSVANAGTGTNVLPSAATSFTTITDKQTEDQLPTIQPPGDSDWTPDAQNFHGNWRSKFEKSSWHDKPALQAAPGETAVAGRVLTLKGQPLSDVSIGIGKNIVRTDKTGRFLLTSVSPGHQVMLVDGRTASQPGRIYGLFREGIDVTARTTNVLPYTIWMPRLDMAHAVSIASPNRSEVVITNPNIPGLELHLPAGTVIRDLDGNTVRQVSITPIPTDQPPFPLPSGVNVPTFFTIQPGGAQVIPPRAFVVYPNFTNDVPGTRISFWNYDPTEKGWYVYGKGTVSANGKQVIPDAGVVLYEFSGLMTQTNNPDPAAEAPNPSGDPGWPCTWLGWFCGPTPDPGSPSGTPSGPSGPGPRSAPKGPGAPRPPGPRADPVDPGSGLFVLNQRDLLLPDILPLSLTRTYRPGDSASRPFGIGATHPYAMFLWGANESQWQEMNLILPDSGRIHYVRISPGTSYSNAVFEHTETATMFYKSRVAWNGNGWSLTLKEGTVLVFGSNAPLQAIRDRNGNQITISWSNGSSGNITRITSPNNRWIQLSYDSSNRITQATDNIGRTVGYTYDAGGRLWKVTNPTGGVTEYTYDSSHRMLTIKDPRSIVYLTNQYDIGGRVTKQTLADGNTYEFAYTLNGAGKITQTDITDQRGTVNRMTFNSAGLPMTDTAALGKSEEQTITYERQSGSNIISAVTDQLNRRTTFTRDADGYITESTALAETSGAVASHFTYEPAFHGLASATDGLGHATTFSYDAKGNWISSTNALGHQVNFAYNGSGQLISATDPLNHTTQFTYDGGDLIRVTDPLNRGVGLFVDSAGRLRNATTPSGGLASFESDPLNRLTRVTDPRQGVALASYDPNGNLLSFTDARSSVTSYSYDNMDRVTTRQDPLGRNITYQYNADGTLHQSTDRKGQTTNYSYDFLNRLTQITYADSSTASFTYDAGNRITQVVDSVSGTSTFNYDNLDRLTSKTTPQGTISYSYDAAGRLTSMTVAGQSTVNYTYDNADRVTQVTRGTATVSLAYDAAGRRTSLTLPNGVVTEYTYDAASQLTALTYKLGSAVLGNLTYGYDVEGRRTQIGGSYARTGLPQAVTSATYNAANQQTAVDGQSLTYDLNGNLTSDGTNTYTWNARNQLASITGATLSASFVYDSFGERISKTVNGSTTTYLYDGANLVQELVSGTPTANILSGELDEVFTRTDAAGAWSPLLDGLGSTSALTNSSGSVQTQYTYEPFGNTTFTGGSNGNLMQYTSRENDGTGLYFYRGRYYSPTLQRFISEDPIGLLGGANLYAYVGNNPINFTDPFGLKPKNPGDNPEADKQRREVEKFLKDFVEAGKDHMRNVMEMAALEALGPAMGALTKVGTNALRDAIVDWLGPNTRVITNPAGDKIFLSEDGLRRIRADFNNPAPHSSPHLHVEVFTGGRWVKSGPIYPIDVPSR